MAAFLVLQRLNPHWSKAAFGAVPVSALELLADEAKEP